MPGGPKEFDISGIPGSWPGVPPWAGFWAKRIGLHILDFELRISDFVIFFLIRIPQSTIRNFGGLPGP